jgi:hypothetical protein
VAIQAEVLEAQIKVTGVSQAKSDLGQVEAKSKATAKGVTNAGHSMRNAFAGLAIGAGVVKFLKDSNAEARQSQKVSAQTVAVLKSTKDASNATAKGIDSLANSISRKTGIDDEAIASASNLLATFTNIRNEVGRGNKIFNQATQAATDMGAALGGDPASNAILLGKALNNPTKGLVALTRVGVTFDDQQKAQIATMQKSGNMLGAQKVILHELTKEFGGSAAAQATWGDKATVAWKNLEEQIGLGFQPIFDKALKSFTTKGVPAISAFVTEMGNGTGSGGEFATTLKDLGHSAEDLLPLFKAAGSVTHDLLQLFDSMPAGLRTNALLLVGYGLAINKVTGFTGPMIGKLKEGAAAGTLMSDGLTKMKAAAATAAGAGGLLLLSKGLTQTDSDTRTLQTTLGAAAVGFAIAGPVGAAAGALGGFAASMMHGSDATHTAWKNLVDYSSALDVNTGKLRKNAVQQVIDSTRKTSPQTLAAGKALGFTDAQVAKAIMGNKRIQAEIQRTIALSGKATNPAQVPVKGGGSVDAASVLRGTLAGQGALAGETKGVQGLTAAYAQQAATIRSNAREIQAMKDATDRLPKRVQTLFTDNNTGNVSLQMIERLHDKYNLTPKNVRTLLHMEGYQPTKAQMDTILNTSRTLGKQHPVVHADANTAPATNKINTLGGLLQKIFGHAYTVATRGGGSKGPSLPPGMTAGAHASGGTIAGSRSPYGDKVLVWAAPGEEMITNRNGEADRFRADRASGRIPAYASGGTVGKRKGPSLANELSGAGLLDALTQGLGPVVGVLNKMEALARKRASGAAEKRLEGILKSQGARLEKYASAYQAITAKLTDAVAARDALVQAKADFAGNVTSGISSQANVLQAGNSASQIAANLSTQVGKASEFAAAIQAMKAAGYSSAVIQQVAAAGIEGGLEVAKALVAGGSSDVASINSSFASITNTANQQGKILSDQFYNAGIQSANGVIAGLTKQQAAIEKTLEAIAKGMIKALRKALGIHSPSKAFDMEMDWVGAGIVKGGKRQHAKVSRAGSALAGAVLGGFRSNTGTLTPANTSQGSQAPPVSLTFVTHNPIAEPQSRTTNNALARVAAIGLVG